MTFYLRRIFMIAKYVLFELYIIWWQIYNLYIFLTNCRVYWQALLEYFLNALAFKIQTDITISTVWKTTFLYLTAINKQRNKFTNIKHLIIKKGTWIINECSDYE